MTLTKAFIEHTAMKALNHGLPAGTVRLKSWVLKVSDVGDVTVQARGQQWISKPYHGGAWLEREASRRVAPSAAPFGEEPREV